MLAFLLFLSPAFGALPAQPNWGDYSTTVQYDMGGLSSTYVVWNALSLSKASEDWSYWTDIKFNKNYATKKGYEFRIEDGLCGIQHSSFPPVQNLWAGISAEYIGTQVVNGIVCHAWKQKLLSDFILTYADVTTGLPVKEIHVTSSYNTSSTYLNFSPGVPSHSHFVVPVGCPSPPDTPEETGAKIDPEASKHAYLQRIEQNVRAEWKVETAPVIDDLMSRSFGNYTGHKLDSFLGSVEEQRTLQPYEYITFGPVPPNKLIYLQYYIKTENGNSVDAIFLDGENYKKFEAGESFRYFTSYSRIGVATADFPAQTFRGSNTEYFLVVHASTWNRPIVMDMQVSLRYSQLDAKAT